MASNKLLLSLVIFLGSLFFLFPVSVRANPQYFGYYNLNGLPPDSRSHIAQVGARGNTNIGHLIVGDIAKVREHLSLMRDHHLQAILNVFWIFRGSGWRQSWDTLRQALVGYEDVVYGFYFDEPIWTGIDLASFRDYTRQIRSDYPQKAVIAVEAYPPLENNTIPSGYFEYVTDLGFDYYPSLYTLQSGGFDAAWNRYLADFAKLKTLAAGKKIWLVPDGWNNPSIPPIWLSSALLRYHALAKATPSVVGLLVFRYDPGDNSTYYTIQDVLNPSSQFYSASVAYTFDSVGHAIIGATPSPSPTLSKPGDLTGDGKTDLFDYNLLIAKFGSPYTLLDFNAIIGNYGK